MIVSNVRREPAFHLSPVNLVQALPLDEAWTYSCLTQANYVYFCSIDVV